MASQPHAPLRPDSGERVAVAVAGLRAYIVSALADEGVSKATALHRVDGALTHIDAMLDVLPRPRAGVEVVELPAGEVVAGA